MTNLLLATVITQSCGSKYNSIQHYTHMHASHSLQRLHSTTLTNYIISVCWFNLSGAQLYLGLFVVSESLSVVLSDSNRYVTLHSKFQEQQELQENLALLLWLSPSITVVGSHRFPDKMFLTITRLPYT